MSNPSKKKPYSQTRDKRSQQDNDIIKKSSQHVEHKTENQIESNKIQKINRIR